MAGHATFPHEGETATWDPHASVAARAHDRTPPDTFSVLISGDAGTQVFRLARGEVKTLGRASPADWVVSDRSLSRVHARLRWLPEGVQVEDLGSKNGLTLDGERITSTLLRADSVQLRLGHVRLSVRRHMAGVAPGLDDCERFLTTLDEELLRASTFRRSLSLLMLRTTTRDGYAAAVQRARKELRAVDRVTEYAPGVLLVLAPELGLAEALNAARWLVREPRFLCGVASNEQFAGSACTALTLIAAARSACRAASPSRAVVSAEGELCAPQPAQAPVLLSPRMIELYELATRSATRETPVLILGETGTGKELIARHIHDVGARRAKPMIALNCGAIPKELVEATLFGHERGAFTGANELRRGVFEEADGGTLFLDEIGELPLHAQAALLRVLETKQLSRVGSVRPLQVDVRVLSATHCDLAAMVEQRSFRADLYHRLNPITLRVPALRERPEEIAALAHRFIAEAQRGEALPTPTLSAAALERLQRYAWPGNVRELRNVIELAVFLRAGAEITPGDLPEHVRAAQPKAATTAALAPKKRFSDQVRNVELELIRDALRRADNNQTQAARLLDMPLRTLVYKIRAYGLRKLDYPQPT